MFSVHTTSEKSIENATITSHVAFVFEENSGRNSNDHRGVIIFEKLHFSMFLSPHYSEKPAFSNSSCLKSVLFSVVDRPNRRK